MLLRSGFSSPRSSAGSQPGDRLRLYIWGDLNQVRSSRHLEKACVRDLEALWLMRRLTPDYRTIAAFRHCFSAWTKFQTDRSSTLRPRSASSATKA
jgi:Transposase domain (DUF772)